MKDAESKVERLREAIKIYVESSNTSKLDFPEVAKLSIRKTAGTWQIEDQEKLDKHLIELRIIEDVATQNWKYDKKALNKLLDDLRTNNNLCEGVNKTEDRKSISVTYYKTAENKSKAVEAERDAKAWDRQYSRSPAKSEDFDDIKI
ncbi:MAG: hypothetical protein IIA60_01050 [Candidatus Marinimicrobia bacterium]|nr:hypothetical protein [Candidatus Neomarinimicrobiota bacterium]